MTLTAQDAIIWGIQENSLAGFTFDQNFEATGAGSTTTIVSSTLGAGQSGNDDLVGKWVVCVQVAAGTGISGGAPLKRRITAYNHGATTLTIEALPFATADGDQFALLTPQNIWLADDTGGETYTISDASLDMADDFPNGNAERGGPYVFVVESDNIAKSEVKRVLNYTSSTSDLSVASAFSGATAVGDLFDVAECPEIVEGGPLTISPGRVERNSPTGTFGKPAQPAGLWDGGGQVTLAYRGPGSSRIGDPAECHTPFRCVMTTSAISDCVVGSSSTITAVSCSSGSPVAGDIFATEFGDVMVASSVSDTTITPSPTLRTAPATGTTLYGGQKYTPATTLQYAMWIQQWLGTGIRKDLFGCAPKISFSGEAGAWLKINLDFMAGDGSVTTLDSAGAALNRAWRPLLPSVAPRILRNMRVVIGSTELELRSFDLDLGLDIQKSVNLKAPNHNDGMSLRTDAPTGRLGLWADADAKAALHDFIQGREQTLLIQSGAGYGDPGIWMFWAYKVQYTGDEIGDDGGKHTLDLPFMVTEDRTETTLPRWLIGSF